jgi:hypothetical protein
MDLKRRLGPSVENYLLRRLPIIVVTLVAFLPFAALSRTTGDQPIVPLADHHTHVWSVDASRHITEPLVELPEGLRRLLQDKEKFGGNDKNPSALADLYTEDALVFRGRDYQNLEEFNAGHTGSVYQKPPEPESTDVSAREQTHQFCVVGAAQV